MTLDDESELMMFQKAKLLDLVEEEKIAEHRVLFER